MNFNILLFAIVAPLVHGKSIVTYPNFVQSLKLPAVVFPDSPTITTTTPAPQVVIYPVPYPVYPVYPVYCVYGWLPFQKCRPG